VEHGFFGVSSPNGRAWRLHVNLPAGFEEDTTELFAWLRAWLIPACLHAPVQVTLSLHPPEPLPEDVDPEE